MLEHPILKFQEECNLHFCSCIIGYDYSHHKEAEGKQKGFQMLSGLNHTCNPNLLILLVDTQTRSSESVMLMHAAYFLSPYCALINRELILFNL